MDNHLYVETIECGSIVLRGDVQKILSNRRAFRMLKDNSVFTVDGDAIVFDRTEDFTKTMDRIYPCRRRAQT